jgi:hypothetical protein
MVTKSGLSMGVCLCSLIFEWDAIVISMSLHQKMKHIGQNPGATIIHSKCHKHLPTYMFTVTWQ